MTFFLAFLAAAAGPAAAQPEPGPPSGRAARQQLFVAPSGEPFRAPADAAYPSAAWFVRADANHDGRVDVVEFTRDFAVFFDQLDINHDHVLSPSEITRYEQEIVPQVSMFEGSNGRSSGGGKADMGSRHGGGMGSGGGGRRGGPEGDRSDEGGDGDDTRPNMALMDTNRVQGAGRFGVLNIPEPIAAMDVDLNGTVTVEEMRAAAARRFILLDKKSHGFFAFADLPPTAVQDQRDEQEKREKKRSGRRER